MVALPYGVTVPVRTGLTFVVDKVSTVTTGTCVSTVNSSNVVSDAVRPTPSVATAATSYVVSLNVSRNFRPTRCPARYRRPVHPLQQPYMECRVLLQLRLDTNTLSSTVPVTTGVKSAVINDVTVTAGAVLLHRQHARRSYRRFIRRQRPNP